jgi:DNA polymerase-3 subunit delta'
VSVAGRVEEDVSHPRATTVWFGNPELEKVLLAAYRSGRIPHAWLFCGRAGVGKATLAYRLARFVLAHPDPASPEVQVASSLAVEQNHMVARRIAAQAHPDLLVLERTPGESGALRTVITVDQVRRTLSFFGSTSGEGGWRICIVDSADDLKYPEGANALLKVLEEPPPRSLFLLISHAPGRLLATIRSRCRRLALGPLDAKQIVRAATHALGRDGVDADLDKAAQASDGSVGRAITLLRGPALAIRDRVIELLSNLPAVDPHLLHTLGDALSRADDDAYGIFIDTIRDWLRAQLNRTGEIGRLARVAEVWEKLDRAAREVEIFNLDRKPMVFAVFGHLAEAARH